MEGSQHSGFGAGGQPPQPVAVQQTTVIQMSNHKSVAGAVLLALFFGPLGMIYSTVVGALVMLVINILVAIATLGLGLILTLPICAIWAGIAANNHNQQLNLAAHAAVPFAAATPASPAAWHDDPNGSGRLRYYDGLRWTDHYADHPGAAPAAAAAPEPEPPLEITLGGARSAETAETEVAGTLCISCRRAIAGSDRFCPPAAAPRPPAEGQHGDRLLRILRRRAERDGEVLPRLREQPGGAGDAGRRACEPTAAPACTAAAGAPAPTRRKRPAAARLRATATAGATPSRPPRGPKRRNHLGRRSTGVARRRGHLRVGALRPRLPAAAT